MPTLAEYEQAAAMFRSAAGEVGAVASELYAIDTRAVLRGGLLGRQVPSALASTAVEVGSSQADLLAAEVTCLERASLIADYLAEVAVYDRRSVRYARDQASWQRDYDSWYYGGDELPHPGAPPIPPIAPVAPPPWADVRRP